MRLIRSLICTACLAQVSACVGDITDEYNLGGADASPEHVDAGSNPLLVDAQTLDDGAPVADPPDAAPARTVWKATLMTGDDSIAAFDNARETIKGLFEGEGILDVDTIQLSRDPGEQVNGVRDTSVSNFEGAMLDHNVGAGDGCVVFMTSHGNQTGFYIRGRDVLTPTRLNQILDSACGTRPTVALISACFSGVFVAPAEKPNRIILTAAREDRTSFGCSAESTYTYWDGCLIDNFPTVDTWSELYDSVSACIEAKEGGGGFTPSYPQGFFGSEVQDLRIFHR